MKPIDHTGSRFGKLTVVEFLGSRLHSGKQRRMWRCLCDCGNTVDLPADQIVYRRNRTCGCASKTQQGLSNLYRSEQKCLNGAIYRCTNPKFRAYKNYGGRGIRVCERWQGPGGLARFVADMGRRPPGMSLDRYPDNNGNYEPGNCRWATPKEQCRNKRTNVLVTAHGRTATVSEWADITGIGWNTILARVNKGWSHEDVVSVPPGHRRGTYVRAIASTDVLLTFNGRTMNQTDWGVELGLSMKTLSARLNKLGWSIERTLSTPIRGSR